MKRYINYFKYVVKHKCFVLYAGMKYFPSTHMLYRLLMHDISKFSPMEFIAYAQTFYLPNGDKQYDETIEFSQAWNHHQKCNAHHWQYWVLKYDRGDNEELPMPDIYIEEMIADWIGAGRAITGSWDNVFSWYEKSNVGRFLHPSTRNKVEEYLIYIKNYSNM